VCVDSSWSLEITSSPRHQKCEGAPRVKGP
jgi:hypothetical protein